MQLGALAPEECFLSAEKGTIRTLFSSAWERRQTEAGEILVYCVRGEGFLHHMVRNLVGTMLEASRGLLKAEDIPAILAARSRSAAGPTAPRARAFSRFSGVSGRRRSAVWRVIYYRPNSHLSPNRQPCYPEINRMPFLARSSAFSRVMALASQRPVHAAFAWLHGNPMKIMDWQAQMVAIPAPPFLRTGPFRMAGGSFCRGRPEPC